jgi:predicted Ser/Thr protein kinase
VTGNTVACARCHTPIPENSRYCLACGADVSGGYGGGGGGGGGARADAAGSEPALRERLERALGEAYRIERLLGKGGMGVVYLAQDLTLERAVAIKVLPPEVAQDEQVVRRFQQEAKTAARLDHPNIIPIYRVESAGGLHYFVMKYIPGTSLEDLLERREPLPLPEIQRILWEAACALGHAHQRGVVHRDVKPANIMFDHDGRVMLTDFGISKALQAATGFTATGLIIGTPHYMAPEQAKGAPVDGRADQYALGVVGYRMVTGDLPFSGDSIHTILYKHIFEEAPLVSAKRPEAPGFLTAAIARALSKDPEARFPTMEDFATAVWPEQPVAAPRRGTPAGGGGASAAAAAAVTVPLRATPLRRPEPRHARRARRPPARVLVGAAVVAAVGVGGYLALNYRTSGAPSPAAGSAAPAAPPAAGEPAPRAVDTVRVEDTVRVPVPVPARAAPAAPRALPRREAAPPPPEPQSFLTIAADPFAEVYIDGADAGQTPLVEYAVKPGRHTIRIERPGFKTVSETVQVAPGDVVRKRYTLLPE